MNNLLLKVCSHGHSCFGCLHAKTGPVKGHNFRTAALQLGRSLGTSRHACRARVATASFSILLHRNFSSSVQRVSPADPRVAANSANRKTVGCWVRHRVVPPKAVLATEFAHNSGAACGSSSTATRPSCRLQAAPIAAAGLPQAAQRPQLHHGRAATA